MQLEEINDYKTFFILTSKDNCSFNSLEVKDKLSYRDSKAAVIKSIDNIRTFLEVKILWEEEKEIKSEALNLNGDIIPIKQFVKEVNKAFLWVSHERTPYLFVFTPKQSSVRKLQHILLNEFCIETENFILDNNFYNNLMLTSRNLKSISYKTKDTNLSSITVNGLNLNKNYLNDYIKFPNKITDTTVIIMDKKIRFQSSSKITVYDISSYNDIVDVLEITKELLLGEGDYYR